jgi:hypothetical protein
MLLFFFSLELFLVILFNHGRTHQNGWTPLIWAADKGHTEVVKMLLEHGADANLANKVSVGRREMHPSKALAIIFYSFYKWALLPFHFSFCFFMFTNHVSSLPYYIFIVHFFIFTNHVSSLPCVSCRPGWRHPAHHGGGERPHRDRQGAT